MVSCFKLFYDYSLQWLMHFMIMRERHCTAWDKTPGDCYNTWRIRKECLNFFVDLVVSYLDQLYKHWVPFNSEVRLFISKEGKKQFTDPGLQASRLQLIQRTGNPEEEALKLLVVYPLNCSFQHLYQWARRANGGFVHEVCRGHLIGGPADMLEWPLVPTRRSQRRQRQAFQSGAWWQDQW